jgi:iron(III) transport system substrate-binding protein
VSRASRSRTTVALAIAGGALLAACGTGGSSSESATGSGDKLDNAQLVVYSGRQKPLVEPLLEAFEKRTGVKVSARYAGSAELAQQLIEEGDRSAVDVFFSQDAGALGALSKQGRLKTLPASTLEHVSPRFRATNGEWVGVSGRVRVLVYDPRKATAAELPKSIDEVTDDRWKSKVGFAPTNASFQAFVTGLRVVKGDDGAKKWLEDFKSNQPKSYDNNLAILDAVERGELELGLINHYYWYEKAHEIGEAKMRSKLHFFGNGDPGGLINVAGAGVPKSTDRPAEAQKFVDFLLSPEAQTYFREETFEYPLTDDVKAGRDLPDLDQLDGPDVDLSELSTLERTLALLDEVGLT